MRCKTEMQKLQHQFPNAKIMEVFPNSEVLLALNHIERYIGTALLCFERKNGFHSRERWVLYLGLIERCLSIPGLATSSECLRVCKGQF